MRSICCCAEIISKFDDIEISTTLVSVMKVETTSDFSFSKIYISVFGDEEKKKRIVKKLNDNKKTIRYDLAHKVRLRTVPELSFIVDDVEERAERVLIVATGALFSPTFVYQKEPILSISHAVSLESVK